MWRALNERDRGGAVKYHVWHHPQEGVIRLGPDGTFRSDLLTEVEDVAILDIEDSARDTMEVRADGKNVRVRYNVTEDVDLSQLEDSAQISRMVRSDPFFKKRADFQADCAAYDEKACAAQGCFFRHGSWGGPVTGRQFTNSCEDIQTACAEYATMDDATRQKLGQENSQDVAALERRCGARGAGLGAAYREQRDQVWQERADKAVKYTKYLAALGALAAAWIYIYPILQKALPTVQVPSLEDIQSAPARAMRGIQAQLGAMWPAVTEEIQAKTGVDLQILTEANPSQSSDTPPGGPPPPPTARTTTAAPAHTSPAPVVLAGNSTASPPMPAALCSN